MRWPDATSSIKIFRKCYYTLLEVLIVFTLIGLCAVLTGVKIKKIVSEQQFLTETQQIASHLQSAQDIMLILQIDTEMKFVKDPSTSNIKYQLTAKKPLPPKWKKILENEYELKSIRRIDFEEHSTQNSNGFILLFYSRGMSMSQGKMILSKNENNSLGPSSRSEDYQIELLGHPHFIDSQRFQQKEREFAHRNNSNLYPQLIFNDQQEKNGQP